MAGLAGRVCPECGHNAQFEANLHRWHRRYRWLTLGLLLLVASWVAWVAPAVRRGGWIAAVPSSVLFLTPQARPHHVAAAANAEILQRAAAGRLSPWQLQAMVDRLAPKLLITRPVWPTETPIRFEAGTVWSSGRLGTVSLATRPVGNAQPPAPEWPRPDLSHEQVWSDRQWSLPPMPAGRHELMAEVVVTRPLVDADGRPASGPPTEVWRGTVRRTIQVAGSPAELLNPVSLATLDDFLRTQTRPRLVRLPSSGTLVVYLDRLRGPLVEGTTIAMKLDFLQGDKPVATARRFFVATGNQGVLNPPALLVGDTQALPRSADTAQGWTLRVSGDAEFALRDFHSTAFWDGSFELPLADVFNPPPRPLPERSTPAAVGP